MMLRASMPVVAGNKALKDGSLPKTVQSLTEQLKPEAVYFTACGGERTMYMVFDMKDSSQLPSIAEPLFTALEASIDIQPAMNADDLKKGLEAARK
jgi:hypothetical protein